MRFCNSCNRITLGEPLYCNYCGSSYEVKLCHARHPNPRNAVVCSQCGSREFSQPAPPLTVGQKLGIVLLKHSLGIFLGLLTSIALFMLAKALVEHGDEIVSQIIRVAMCLAVLWFAYLFAVPILNGLFGRPPNTRKRGRH